MSSTAPYRVHRRRGPLFPALFLGLVQVAIGLDTLWLHKLLPPASSPIPIVASALFVLIGVVLIVYAGGLLASRPLLEANERGIWLSITAPGQPSVHIPWDALKDIKIAHDVTQKGSPECLVIRFIASRVRRPEKLVGVLKDTRSSFWLRGSQMPPLAPILQELETRWRAHAGAKEDSDV